MENGGERKIKEEEWENERVRKREGERAHERDAEGERGKKRGRGERPFSGI